VTEDDRVTEVTESDRVTEVTESDRVTECDRVTKRDKPASL
jgi:hypothetical protein